MLHYFSYMRSSFAGTQVFFLLFAFLAGVSCLSASISLRGRPFDFIMLSVCVCVCVALNSWLLIGCHCPSPGKAQLPSRSPCPSCSCLVYVTSVCSSASGQAEVQLNCWTRLKEATKTGCFCIKSSCFLPPKNMSASIASVFQLQPVFVTFVLDFFFIFLFV